MEKRRRFIKGAGIAAPVVLTLASPSVFGIQCQSEIASGNQSQNPNGSCELGKSITELSSPSSQAVWTAAGYTYGTKQSQDTDICSNYSGGTKFSDVFGVNPTTAVSPSSLADTTMLSIICSATTNTTLDAYLVAALLNAKTPGSNYLYTGPEVIKLKNKTLGVPPLNSIDLDAVKAFLITTMYPSVSSLSVAPASAPDTSSPGQSGNDHTNNGKKK